MSMNFRPTTSQTIVPTEVVELRKGAVSVDGGDDRWKMGQIGVATNAVPGPRERSYRANLAKDAAVWMRERKNRDACTLNLKMRIQYMVRIGKARQ
nr:hypothetical protein CFP56_13294 [Quercus suber]